MRKTPTAGPHVAPSTVVPAGRPRRARLRVRHLMALVLGVAVFLGVLIWKTRLQCRKAALVAELDSRRLVTETTLWSQEPLCDRPNPDPSRRTHTKGGVEDGDPPGWSLKKLVWVEDQGKRVYLIDMDMIGGHVA